MYRVSPFTYLVQGMLGVAVAHTEVVCAQTELLTFDPPSGQTCGAYMTTYITTYGGYLVDSTANANCEFCSIQSTDVFLSTFGISYGDRWRNFGLMFVYIIFNIAAAIGLYWLARVVSLLVAEWGHR